MTSETQARDEMVEQIHDMLDSAIADPQLSWGEAVGKTAADIIALVRRAAWQEFEAAMLEHQEVAYMAGIEQAELEGLDTSLLDNMLNSSNFIPAALQACLHAIAPEDTADDHE